MILLIFDLDLDFKSPYLTLKWHWMKVVKYDFAKPNRLLHIMNDVNKELGHFLSFTIEIDNAISSLNWEKCLVFDNIVKLKNLFILQLNILSISALFCWIKVTWSIHWHSLTCYAVNLDTKPLDFDDFGVGFMSWYFLCDYFWKGALIYFRVRLNSSLIHFGYLWSTLITHPVNLTTQAF